MYNDKHKEMLGKMHILLVDDDLQLRNVIRVTLESVGYVCSEAGDGQEARRFLEGEQGVGLIVTDHQMPEMSGIEFCRQMRTLENFADVPVIMLTAKGLELDLDHLKESLGVAEAFAKPYSPQKVISTAESLLATATPCSN